VHSVCFFTYVRLRLFCQLLCSQFTLRMMPRFKRVSNTSKRHPKVAVLRTSSNNCLHTTKPCDNLIVMTYPGRPASISRHSSRTKVILMLPLYTCTGEEKRNRHFITQKNCTRPDDLHRFLSSTRACLIFVVLKIQT
jgi:hypothetical protein